MTWLAFIASMTGSLAWPVVIAVLAVLFRNQVAVILRRLTRIKAWGSEVEFGAVLDNVEKLAPPLPETSKSDVLTAPHHGGDTALFDVETRASLPPAYRIISSWKSLYSAISDAAQTKGLAVKGYLGRREISSIGQAIGLSTQRIEQINELRDLRDSAANKPDQNITVTDALRYEALVRELLDLIKSGNQGVDAAHA
jgi:hypothetical protein